MFPDFNIYSIPLLILVFQGLILVGLLYYKSNQKNDLSSFLLATLLLVTCYHRTTYTIGFMAWYDTFRTTKINYYLVSFVLSIGPLIYLYIKSVGERNFKINKKHLLHFAPLLCYTLFSIAVLIYDSTQPNFQLSQNGELKQWEIEHLLPIFIILFSTHLLVYLIFSFQLYYKIRSRLKHQFSNTYNFELLWLRNFLYLFTFLFVYNSIQMLTDGFIFDLHWTDEWWYQVLSLIVVLYVGLRGFFTPLEKLPRLENDNFYIKNSAIHLDGNEPRVIYQKKLEPVLKIVEQEKLYLDPNLTLNKLARLTKLPPSQLSLYINNGTGQNFNEFINTYRVKTVREKLLSEEYNHLSILAIALDAGFNSKATFNRVFKKLDGNPPSFYRKN